MNEQKDGGPVSGTAAHLILPTRMPQITFIEGDPPGYRPRELRIRAEMERALAAYRRHLTKHQPRPATTPDGAGKDKQ